MEKVVNNNLNQENSQSQCKQIAAWLQSGRSITALEALRLFGCMRLASRICDLRKRGMEIIAETITLGNNKRVTEYKLNK